MRMLLRGSWKGSLPFKEASAPTVEAELARCCWGVVVSVLAMDQRMNPAGGVPREAHVLKCQPRRRVCARNAIP